MRNLQMKGKIMETIKDIVEQMRHGIIPRYRHDHELLRFFADRIEAAVANCNQFKIHKTIVETEKRINKVISILTEIPDSCGYGGLLEDAAELSRRGVAIVTKGSNPEKLALAIRFQIDKGK